MMKARRFIPVTAAAIALAAPGTALASAEGPGTPQATAANATFLAEAPAPATPGAVCVIDTGADTNTDLGASLLGRVAQIGGVSGDPGDTGAIADTGEPLTKHGTYVAGVIASQIDGVGTNGIWPAGRVYSNRVFAGGSTTTVADYNRAIDWCRSQPNVKVINLSLSGLAAASTAERGFLNNKITQVRDAPYRINVVAAAGNNGSHATVGYPALADGVLAVGATDASGALAGFSNRGTGLDIATFGTATCVTTGYGTHLAEGAGTSFATPVVSAVLAALRSYNPGLTPDEAEALLLNNADVVGGVKILNAAKAFRADPTIASLAASAPASGLNAAVANACEPPPVAAAAGGGGGGGGASGGAKDVDRSDAQRSPQTITVTPNPVPAPIVDVELPSDDPFATLKPQRPMLRSVKHRRGVLTVRISGYQPGERALYRVTYRAKGKTKTRRYVRKSGTLKVRVRNWKVIRVQLQRPGVGISRTLVIRPNVEF